MVKRVEIIAGDHVPPYPLMVVDGEGFQVDMSTVSGGQLWDEQTTARIEWGLKTPGEGRIFGRVILKNGQVRPFFETELLTPYLNAYAAQRDKLGLGPSDHMLTRQRPTQDF